MTIHSLKDPKLLNATAYLAARDSDQYWAKNEPGRVGVGRANEQQIGVSFTLGDDPFEVAGFYFSNGEARRLIEKLEQALAEPW